MSAAFFYHFMFAVTLLSCMAMLRPVANGRIIFCPGKSVDIVGMIVVTLLLSSLPVLWNSGADRDLYANSFLQIQQGYVETMNDRLFGWYVKVCGYLMDCPGWFLLTAFIYSFNHYYFASKLSRGYAYILLLMLFTSFMFYSYGTNTIRAGFAASFLLLALANYKRTVYFIGFLLVAVGCHASMMIPAAAIVVSRFFNKTKWYLFFWFLSIILSATMGSYFETLFSSFSIDSRTSYLNVSSEETHYKVGFRVDFILYSCLPVLAGYYYVVRKKFKDEIYTILLNTYILANSFWILVIRADFSDRFAYLSWFIYPAVLIYPLLKQSLVANQRRKIVWIVFLHELFTYIMFLR